MPERQCDGCRKQVEWGCEATPYTAIDAKGQEKVRWHKPARLPLSVLGESEVWYCPRQGLHENPAYWNTVLKFYGMYRRGFLPDPGAIVDQSNKAIEVFRVLDDINAQCDREELRKPFDSTPVVQTPGRKGR